MRRITFDAKITEEKLSCICDIVALSVELMVVQPLFKLIVGLDFLSSILYGILGKRKRKSKSKI
jgi:hypothetical protein